MLTTRFQFTCLGLGAAALTLIAGCGQDVGSGCVGHACANSAAGLPEGGEVRLELVTIKDGNWEVRTHAWFASAQVPDERLWPRGSPAVWKEMGPGFPAFCTDMTNNDTFPSGDPESRTDLDVGETVKLVAGAKEIDLTRNFNAQDTTLNNHHDIVYLSDRLDAANLAVKTDYTVSWTGTDSFPAQQLTLKLRVPDMYKVTFPNMEDQVTIPRDSDFPFTWEGATNDPFDFAFISFNDAIDPLFYCIGPNYGSFKVPKEVLEKLPPGGVVQHGIINHKIDILNGRHVDVLGVTCHQSNYLIVFGNR